MPPLRVVAAYVSVAVIWGSTWGAIKVGVNGEDEAKEHGTLEGIVRRVGPGVVGTATTALIERFTRPSEATADGRSPSAVPAYD